MNLALAYLFIFTILANGFAAPARAQDCATSPFSESQKLVGNLITPFQTTDLHLNNYNLDETSARIAWLENETLPPWQRKTLTVKVRGSVAGALNTKFSSLPVSENSLNSLRWDSDGSVDVQYQYVNPNSIPKGYGFPTQHFTQQQLQSMSYAQLLKSLSTLAQNPLLHPPPIGPIGPILNGNSLAVATTVPTAQLAAADQSNLAVLAAYLKLTSQTNQGGIQQTLGEFKNELTNAEKIQLVRTVIWDAAVNHYSEKRAETLVGPEIPYADIITNLHQVTLNAKSPDGTSGVPLGVCRDIAVAQTQMLSQLGFKDVYAIGYDAGQNHVAAIMRDPDHPNQIINFNYSDMQTAQLNQGTRSLTRDEDYSTVYNVFNASGKSVANIPTELGAAIMEGAGGNVQNLDQFMNRTSYSIAGMYLGDDQEKTSVFVAPLSDGTVVAGVGLTTSNGDPDKKNLYYTTTTAGVYTTKNSIDSSGDKNNYNSLQLSNYSKLQLATNWVPISSNDEGTSSVRAASNVSANVDLAATELSKHVSLGQGYGTSGTLNAEGSVLYRYQSADHKSGVQTSLTTQIGLGTPNVSGERLTHIYDNIIYADAQGHTLILPEHLKATLDFAVARRVFGMQALLQGGVSNANGSWAASGGYQGALKKQAFTIAPGMERAFFMDVDKRIGHSIYVTIDYTQHSVLQLGAKASLSEVLKGKKFLTAP
jgi:hypothetical protein